MEVSKSTITRNINNNIFNKACHAHELSTQDLILSFSSVPIYYLNLFFLINTQKNIFQIVTPGPRNQIVSPYTNSTLDVSGTRNTITQEDLNMRRKVEILQYNKNGSKNHIII